MLEFLSFLWDLFFLGKLKERLEESGVDTGKLLLTLIIALIIGITVLVLIFK